MKKAFYFSKDQARAIKDCLLKQAEMFDRVKPSPKTLTNEELMNWAKIEQEIDSIKESAKYIVSRISGIL